MSTYRYVPDAFGVGMIIPLLKGDDCDNTVADNYRVITDFFLSVCLIIAAVLNYANKCTCTLFG